MVHLAVFLLAPLLGGLCAQTRSEAEWDSRDTTHFTIHREAMGVALGDHERIERLYEALHRELWTLVPWMDQEKVHVYLYRDSDSYAGGRFNPPPWSAGLASLSDSEKALALPEPLDTSVTAHEMSHLYLQAYFRQKKNRPPPWLDEGLAGMLQDEALNRPDPGDLGPVLPTQIPLKDFVRSRPEKDTPQAAVGLWYRQAHSVVRFLKRGHVESQFTEFCRRLRERETLEAALLAVYGYTDLATFEKAWHQWRPKRARGAPPSLSDS